MNTMGNRSSLARAGMVALVFLGATTGVIHGARPPGHKVPGLALKLEPVLLAPADKQRWRITNTGTVPILPSPPGTGFQVVVKRIGPNGQPRTRSYAICGNYVPDDSPIGPGESAVVTEPGDFGYGPPGPGHLRATLSFRVPDGTKHAIEADFDLEGYGTEQLDRVRSLLTDQSLAGCAFRAPLFTCATQGASPRFHDFAAKLGELPVDEANAYTVGLATVDNDEALASLRDHGPPTLRVHAMKHLGGNDEELTAVVRGRQAISTEILDAIDPFGSEDKRAEHMDAWLTRFETESDPMVLCWILYRLTSALPLHADEHARLMAAVPAARARLHHPLARRIFQSALRSYTHPHYYSPWKTIWEMQAALAAALPRPPDPAACADHNSEARALAGCNAPDFLHALHLVQRIRTE